MFAVRRRRYLYLGDASELSTGPAVAVAPPAIDGGCVFHYHLHVLLRLPLPLGGHRGDRLGEAGIMQKETKALMLVKERDARMTNSVVEVRWNI